jgi:hypothetical protein
MSDKCQTLGTNGVFGTFCLTKLSDNCHLNQLSEGMQERVVRKLFDISRILVTLL